MKIHIPIRDLFFKKIYQKNSSMIPIIFLLVFSIIFLYLTVPKYKDTVLPYALFPLFLVLAFRTNFGNDYQAYQEIYIYISNSENPFSGIFERDLELGWIALNLLFKPLGYELMVAFLTLFSFYVIVKFIGRYCPSKYYWLAIALYVLNPTNLLIELSAQRQTLALMLFLLSVQYIEKKEFINYFKFIILASFIHASAIALSPLYFISNIKLKYSKILIVTGLSIYIISFILIRDEIISQLMSLLLIYGDFLSFDKYAEYQELDSGEASLGLGFGIIYNGIILTMLLKSIMNQTNEVKPIFLISIISIFFIPFIGVLGAFERFSSYLSIFLIVTIPILAQEIKNIFYRYSFLAVNILLGVWRFLLFFENPTYQEYYKNIYS